MNSQNVFPSSHQEWWPCVVAIAGILKSECLDISDDALIHDSLKHQNFSKDHVDRALEWLQDLRTTGHFADAVSILSQDSPKERTENQIEKIFLPTQFWSRLSRLRSSGALPVEMVELMVETSRQVDMRDWDEESINEFFENLVLMLGGSEKQSRFISASHSNKNLLC